MAQPPEPPSAEEAEQQAARARHAAEAAAIGLFVVAAVGGEDQANISPADAAKVSGIFTDLLRATLFQIFPDPGLDEAAVLYRKELESALDDIVRAELPSIHQQIVRLRQSNASAPPRQPGELSLQRQAARALAAWLDMRASDELARRVAESKIYGGRTLKKTWISFGDDRVRPLHKRLHGRTRGWHDDFWRWPMTGQRLRYPYDPEAPPDATFGCRCLLWLSWRPL